jgi:tRNA pseudouridine55 synthase
MIDGIINVLKPPNMTSHDVVSYIRRTVGMKKVGHTGTLDPNAAGVLPICLGKATRVAEYFNDSTVTKIYRAELKLGARTDTQDKYGEVIETREVSDISTDEILSVFNKFTGQLEQTPPMYSAKKINGRKLYELARAGIEVERKSRKIDIFSLDLIQDFEKGSFIFDVECSSGTYVRTLCEDMAYALGNIGYMSFLLRTKVGSYRLDNAHTLEEIREKVDRGLLEEILLPLDTAVKQYERIDIEERYFDQILNGVKIEISDDYSSNVNYRIYCKQEFIGIGMYDEKTSLLKMGKVLFQRR